MKRLEDVVRHYSGGGVPDPHLDPLLKKFPVSHQDVKDIIAFLESLSGDVRPGLAPDYAHRAKTTRVRLLDAARQPMVGVAVDAVPAGDSLPGDVPLLSPERHLVTDSEGAIEFAPPRRTHTRMVLPDGLRLPQGEFIPDSCTHVDLVVPVRGRAAILVVAAEPEDLVDRLLGSGPVWETGLTPMASHLVLEGRFQPDRRVRRGAEGA